jgi:hypothetical protein
MFARFALACACLVVFAGCAKGASLDQSAVAELECRDECEAWAESLFDVCVADDNVKAECTLKLDARLEQCKALEPSDCTAKVQALFAEPAPMTCDTGELAQSHCEGTSIVGTCSNGRTLTLACDSSQCARNKVPAGCRLNDDEQAFCECVEPPCDVGDRYCEGTTLLECSFSGRYTPFQCSDDDCIAAGYGPLDFCGDDGLGNIGCTCSAPIGPSGSCAATDASQCLGASNLAYCFEGNWVATSCEYYCNWQGFSSLGCAGDACQCDYQERLDDACDRGARAFCQCREEGCADTEVATVYSNCYRNNDELRGPIQCLGAYAWPAANAVTQADCDMAGSACL